MSAEKRQQRSQSTYIIDAGLRMLKVLEALRGTNFEPVTIQRVTQRTGYSYDFCRRALITLKQAGFATESPDGWQVGPKLMQFAANFNEVCLVALTQSVSEISESQNP
jgi:DNA-binding IclR family transcriptional regulator